MVYFHSMRLLLFRLIFLFWMIKGLFHFHIAAGLYVFVDIFRPLVFAYAIGAFPASAMAIGTVTLSFFFGLIRKDIQFRPHPLFWLTSLFLLWVVICTKQSPFPIEAHAGLSTILTYIAPAIILSTGLNNRRDLGYLILIAGISVGIWSARFGFNGFLSGVNNAMRIPASQMADNNYFAAAVVASIPLQLFLAFKYEGRAFKFWRKIFMGMALLSVAAVVFSDSRGGALGLFFLIMVYLTILSKHKIRDFFIVIIMSLIVAAILPQSFYDRMSTLNKVGTEEADGSASERLLLIQKSFEAAKDHPKFGVGPYCWIKISQNYTGLDRPMENHNIWLKVWVELGIPGLVLFIIIWLGTIFGLVKTYKKASEEGDEWTTAYSLCLILSLCSLLITYTFLNYWDSEYFWIILGLGASLSNLHKSGDLKKEENDEELLTTKEEDVEALQT